MEGTTVLWKEEPEPRRRGARAQLELTSSGVELQSIARRLTLSLVQ